MTMTLKKKVVPLLIFFLSACEYSYAQSSIYPDASPLSYEEIEKLASSFQLKREDCNATQLGALTSKLGNLEASKRISFEQVWKLNKLINEQKKQCKKAKLLHYR